MAFAPILLAALALGAGPVERWHAPSAGAIAVGADRIALLDPDMLHLELREAATGKLLWRVAFQKEARGAHALYRIPGGVLVYAGDTLVLLDEANGSVKTRQPILPSTGEARCSLWDMAGAFAIMCPCALQPVDGLTAKTVGSAIVAKTFERKRYDSSGWDSGCWGSDPGVLGRAGPLDLLTMGNELHAIEHATGKRAWLSTEGLSFTSEWSRGISPDGSIAWLGDARGSVRVFEVTSGRLLWSRTSAESAQPPHVALWAERGIFLAGPGEAELVQARSGKSIWKRSLAAGERGLPWHGAMPRDIVVELVGPATAVWLDPASGQERGRLAIDKGEGLSTREDGGYRIGPSFQDPRRFYDADLKAQPERAPAFRMERVEAKASVLRRWPEGAVLKRWPEVVDQVAQGKTGEKAWIALQRFPAGVPTELVVLGE